MQGVHHLSKKDDLKELLCYNPAGTEGKFPERHAYCMQPTELIR